MSDLIDRQKAIDAINCDITITGRQNAELVAATIGAFVDRIKALPSAQPILDARDTQYNLPIGTDCISRQAAIDVIDKEQKEIDVSDVSAMYAYSKCKTIIKQLPSELGTNLAEVGTDTISRQAALDAFNHELRCGAVINQCGLEVAYEVIEGLPSAQPEKRTEERTETHGVCLDAISRQAAINAIDECCCGGEDSCGEPWIYKENAVEAINMIEPLPSAELKKGADMKFEDCEDKIKGAWVKVSDVELSLPSTGYAYIEADVHIPYGVMIMDVEEYTKHVQDKAIKMFADAFILNGTMGIATFLKIFPENSESDKTYIAKILKRYSGSEIISRLEEYEKFKQAEKSKKKQAEIEKAKALLESSGYTVIKGDK